VQLLREAVLCFIVFRIEGESKHRRPSVDVATMNCQMAGLVILDSPESWIAGVNRRFRFDRKAIEELLSDCFISYRSPDEASDK